MKSSANGTYTVQTSGRRNFFVILLGIMTIIGGLFYSATDVSAADTLSLIVKMTSGLTVEEQTAVIARNGGVETSSVPALRLHIVTVPTADQPLVQQNYQADAQVVSIEVNRTRKAEAIPTDANYGVQWALSKIGWESVFGTVAPTGAAKLALLDTGVDATHPDLAGVVIPGTSILDGTDGLGDPSGHGTWLAGIAAAATDNGAGIAGIAFGGVQIMPVSVLNAGGTGQDSDIIAGIVWAVDHGADVILMGFSNPDFSQNLQDAVDYAWSKGVVLVAATGNDGVTTPTFPAGDRGVIGVSATDPNDLLAPASNYGQDTFLAAPGTDIYTTGPNGGYSYISGTSASSAFVAGAAAFMKAVDPLLTNGIIVGRLARAADAIGSAGDPNNQAMFGNGRLNMAKALADTGINPVQPAGTPGGGGPYVGPYAAAAQPANVTVTASPTGAIGGIFSIERIQSNGNQQTSGGTTAQTFAVQPSSRFSITGIQATVNGYNYVGSTTVAGTAGVASSTTTVTLNYQLSCTAPSISTHPSNAIVTYGAASVAFTAAASSLSTVQWQVSTDGGTIYVDISGATSGTLIITSPTVALSGSKYRAVFSNCSPALTVTSNAATLTVTQAPSTVT
ncbi:MAG: S8 family serine peptidase, partial [Desulfuromonadaceae bacterium]